MDCVFCRIVEGKAPAWRIYEDGQFLVILDKYPASYGHLLVVSRQHYTNIFDAPVELVTRAFELATRLARAWRRLGAPAVNIVTNAGREAGQVVYHLHIHVVPRWGGPLAWHGREELREETAREVAEKLKAVVPEYLG